MEGTRKNFAKVLADFESRLQGADFVAIDTELTGVELEGEPDTFDESAEVRLDKCCRIAEKYTLIQLGLTVVGRGRENTEQSFTCASYNLFAFPYVGPELGSWDACFSCQASALQFNSDHRVDFNTWIGGGISYLSREDERRLFGSNGNGSLNGAHGEKIGLLRLWKVLCASRLPLVVHTPKDLFFLLAAFERRPLPRQDPRALAALVRQCFPKVYDTAHLHGALGRFKRLGLLKFFEDAKARYDELEGAPPLQFDLAPATAQRYGRKSEDELAHEAGFDSLVTAQLFVYLRAISSTLVREGVNRLFLFRHVEYLDLDRAGREGQVGTNMFDLSRVTLLVAVLDTNFQEAPRLIAASGSVYKWIDSRHVLVVLRASGGAAVRKAAELAAQVHGVVSWMGFDEWRAAQATMGHKRGRLLGFEKTDGDADASRPEEVQEDDGSGDAGDIEQVEADEAEQSPTEFADEGRPARAAALAAVSVGSVLLLCALARRGGPLRAAGARFMKRWRRRR
jgi:hypothetical protein